MMPDAWEQYMKDNPLWWETDPAEHAKPLVSIIGVRRYEPAINHQIETAMIALNNLRADPNYLPVPYSYADPVAQLAYEMAMQNLRNRVALPGAYAKKAPKAALRNMTASENAKRLRDYWLRAAAEVSARSPAINFDS